MSVTRRWYAYNGALGAQFNHLNYFFINNFPNSCLTTANNICAVLGVYSVDTGAGTITYGTNPRSFSADIQMVSYIWEAFSLGTAAPSLSGQRRYVYVRNFT